MSEPRVRGKRGERYRVARALRDEGLLYREIAERMGISLSYAQDLLSDPDGSAVRQRKQSYAGTCEECGRPTTGSNGRDKAPRLCDSCARAASRVWTADAVIYAIRLWAMRHGDGQPPTATQWMRASEDPDGTRYPPATAVYSAEGAPFDSWADAIEAAGFQRPKAGTKGNRGKMMPPTKQREYIVLREDESSRLLTIIATAVLATTNREAIEQVADREGVYLSVPKTGLQRFTVAQRFTAETAPDTRGAYDPTE